MFINSHIASHQDKRMMVTNTHYINLSMSMDISLRRDPLIISLTAELR